MASLLVLEGVAKGKSFELTQPVVRVGRSDANDICIPEPSISGTHCEIKRNGELFQIHDLGSTNGTKVNNEAIRLANVFRNDIILLGSVPCELQGDDVPRSAPANLEGLDIVPRTTIVITPNDPTVKLPPAPGFKPRRDAKHTWLLLFAVLLAMIICSAVYFALAWF